ncbi:MAG: hypothetical protein IPG23_17470 [Burkholderiales bacterium]|nr:hypothetical protein [Burkholderiales bacterium]
MKTQISVPIETDQFLGLVDFLRSNGDARDPVIAIADAIDYWIENASWKPELLTKACRAATSGKVCFYLTAQKFACNTKVLISTPTSENRRARLQR